MTPMEVNLTDDKVEDVIRRIPSAARENIEKKRKGEQLRSQ